MALYKNEGMTPIRLFGAAMMVTGVGLAVMLLSVYTNNFTNYGYVGAALALVLAGIGLAMLALLRFRRQNQSPWKTAGK